MSVPRLTIIVPVFNAAQYLNETIDSLLKQSFRDFEFWIINDGSSDNSWELIEAIADPRVKKFCSQENQGRVATVNKYVEMVETEFVTITDADDISTPDRLQKQINLMDENQKLVMCGTSYYTVNKSGVITGENILSGDSDLIQRNITQKPMFHGPSTVMRLSAIKKLPEFYRSYFRDNRADTDLCARLTDHGMTMNITQPLYLYRVLPDSLSRRNYSPRYAILDKLICFLTKERRANGVDSLMNGRKELIEDYERTLLAEYEKDPVRILYQGAFYHLYWGVRGLALRDAVKAFGMRPFYPKSIFVLLYVVTKGSMKFLHEVFFAQHYRTLKSFTTP